jgi:hypothetical protein|tara:strand:- start:867 stop:1421 length:555 start_codon:yes stop_codon:yes gene_type:complete
MKTQVINNLVSSKELFFVYKELISNAGWMLSGKSTELEYPSKKQFSHSPLFKIKTDGEDGRIWNYPMYLYVQSLIFRMEEILKKKKVGMHTKIKRSWFNGTYHGSKNHWLHQDYKDPSLQTVLMFMTPIWEEAWKGSLHVDGEEFKFKPGNAVIFNSNEFHCGEEPESQTYNWLRLTLNVVLEE